MDILIIGGGASGLMAAYASSLNKSNNVYLYEKNNRLGKKIAITGKGRCNLTNLCSNQEFIEHVVSNPRFLYSSLNTFSPSSLISLLEEYGLETEVQRGNRVFPKSLKSLDVIKTLEKIVKTNTVKVLLDIKVNSIIKIDDKFKVEGIEKDREYKRIFDKVIIATGGLSYKSTGSSGDGYRFASKFRHNIIDLRPGLSRIKILETIFDDLSRLEIKNVSIKYKINKHYVCDFGDFEIEKGYLGGPLIIKMSSFLNRNYKGKDIIIDFKPSLSIEQIQNRFKREEIENKNVLYKDVIRRFLQRDIYRIFIKLLNVDQNLKSIDASNETKDSFIKLMKEFKLTISSYEDINRAIITSGGVDIKEIDPKTMESKLIKGLYFVGEVLDIDALTGGFNLHIAFATGYMAGIGIKND